MESVIYARFSCSKQREESIEDQVRVCTHAARAAGDEIVHVYADSAMSGTTDARPQFRRMVADAAKGSFRRVYVYKLDRFARNRYDAATNRARLRKAGVELVSATEPIPDGPDGILLESLYEGMAEYYSANLAQNVKRGLEGNAQRCMSNGTSIYGYRRGDDGRFVVVENEAAVVRRVFQEYAAGRTMTEVAAAIKAYRTRRGNQFTVGSISRMLRNERYIGVYLYDGTRVEGGMPAIVDREAWDTAQTRLATQGRRRSTMTAGFPLTGVLTDAQGRPYYGTTGTGKSGTTYRYYTNRTTRLYIPAGPLEDAVVRAIDAALDPKSREDVIDAVMAAQDDAGDADVDEAELLQKRLAAIDREQSRIVDAIAKVGFTDAMGQKLAALDEERADVESELAAIEQSAPVIDRDFVAFFLADKCRQRDAGALVPALVSRVVIDEDGKSGMVEFSLIPGYMQIHRENMHDEGVLLDSQLVSPGAENENTPQVGGCSNNSVLVEDMRYVPNFGEIVCIPGGFGVRFAA